jgi:hypothetical protein
MRFILTFDIFHTLSHLIKNIHSVKIEKYITESCSMAEVELTFYSVLRISPIKYGEAKVFYSPKYKTLSSEIDVNHEKFADTDDKGRILMIKQAILDSILFAKSHKRKPNLDFDLFYKTVESIDYVEEFYTESE